MSSFTSELIIEPLENGRDFRLKREFSYHLGSEFSRQWVKVNKNFISDFASIPKLLTIFLPAWAKVNKSSVLHDYLYSCVHSILNNGKRQFINRKRADEIFYEAMLIEFREKRTGKFIAWIEFIAVRMFASFAWRK
jgi:hypothetical protein